MLLTIRSFIPDVKQCADFTCALDMVAFRDQSEKSGEAHEREDRKILRMTYLVKNEALNAGVMWKKAPKLGVEYSIT